LCLRLRRLPLFAAQCAYARQATWARLKQAQRQQRLLRAVSKLRLRCAGGGSATTAIPAAGSRVSIPCGSPFFLFIFVPAPHSTRFPRPSNPSTAFACATAARRARRASALLNTRPNRSAPRSARSTSPLQSVVAAKTSMCNCSVCGGGARRRCVAGCLCCGSRGTSDSVRLLATPLHLLLRRHPCPCRGCAGCGCGASCGCSVCNNSSVDAGATEICRQAGEGCLRRVRRSDSGRVYGDSSVGLGVAAVTGVLLLQLHGVRCC
jgi:hypothetical protein